ncbi:MULTISPECIES: copper chaperone PCu(A)C [unclassified Isoptericola]|uniref:copper chaperone PCu(A)C n=1 Tax=unclassified Isoptericola TaxID=2623355 RepID=UPI00271236C4|nr:MULTISPECIES: copper chaperone PCu(A)C [unclassified Isoptericola]MDO8148957.1 copper chaperone PCu(A)C [Isoptericola sp. b515]MDO8151100.1 copper chaperone PCu(A)C [Isoptericola sp. b408]
MTTRRTTTTLALLLAAGSLGLAGCATEESAAPAATDTTTADDVSIDDAWVKAADAGMTAGFGDITNDGEAEITVVAAATNAAARTELHETAADASGEMSMAEVEGGFVVPAGETLVLEPGGHHLMLMDLAGPVRAGDELTFTLTFGDGSTAELTAPVKDFTGAEESYDGESGAEHGDS